MVHNINIDHCDKNVQFVIDFARGELRKGLHKRGRNLWNLSGEYFTRAELDFARGNMLACRTALNESVEYFLDLCDYTATEPADIDYDYISYQWNWPAIAGILILNDEEMKALSFRQLHLAEKYFSQRDPLAGDFEVNFLKSIYALACGEAEHAHTFSVATLQIGRPLWSERVKLIRTIAANDQSELPDAWDAAWKEWVVDMSEDNYALPEAAVWFFGIALLKLNRNVNGSNWVPPNDDPRLPINEF